MAHQHDLIVIGMGPGGEEVAGTAAQAGMSVLGVEKKLVGGECPYWGCIPSKVMVRASDALGEAARISKLAGRASVTPNWQPVADRVRETTADWDDKGAVERFEKKGGHFRRGAGEIVSPKEVEVDGERFAATRGIVIATGGEPAAPPIDGLSEVDFWTNREAIEATELPKSMIVLGAGPIGLELAQAFNRFGTRITLVEVAEHSLAMEEPENAEAMDEVIRDEGMTLLTDTSAKSVSTKNGGVAVELSNGETIEAERLLVAAGRKLNVSSVGADAMGVPKDAKSIDVDDHMRAGEGLWAVGDVTGKGAFTHMAVYQARIAVADILDRDHAPADYSAVPRVTFTDPEVASVGMTEAQAREAGLEVNTGVAQTSSSTRGWIHGPGAEHGVAKLVADATRGVLVGASVMGPAAGEVIGLLALAIRQGVPVRELRELIYPYPTFVRGIEDALRDLD